MIAWLAAIGIVFLFVVVPVLVGRMIDRMGE